MNFSQSNEQKLLISELSEFCNGHLNPMIAKTDRNNPEHFRDLWKACGKQGILSMFLPEAFGGIEIDAVTSALLTEELGYACKDPGLIFSLSAHMYACITPFLKFATDHQKAQWLPALGSGDLICAHGITEPEAGSDIFSMKTKAIKDGDSYIISGMKCFITNAPNADLFLIHAKTSEGKGYFSLTSFIISKNTPGLSIGPAYNKVGLQSSPLGDIYLDKVRVPNSASLGSVGSGASVFTHSMQWERTCLFALYVGLMRRQMETSIRYTKERIQFGKPLNQFQVLRHKLVDMQVRLEAAKLLLYKSAWMMDQGDNNSMEASIAKLFISESGLKSGLDALSLHGGMGVVEQEIYQLLTDTIPATVFSGTSDIQRNNIAKAMGL